jgi:hypothetical protein
MLDKICAAKRHEGAKGESTYSSYLFFTSALDESEWSGSHHDRTLSPRKGPPVPIGLEAVWVLDPGWTQEEKSSASAGNRKLQIL